MIAARGRAGAQGGGPAPFPIDLESDLDGSGLEGNISHTQIPSSTHSKHSTPSNGSGGSDNGDHGSQDDPAGAGHQVQPKPHPIARGVATSVLAEGSGGPEGSTRPCHTVHVPIPYRTRKI